MRGKAIWGWCLYDWANSAFPTVVLTFVFSTYFTKAVAETPETGAAQWGWAMAAAGLVIAVLSPFLGAMADRSGRRGLWTGGFTALMCLATAGLWRVTPEPSSALLCLVLVTVATICFEIATVFYNALLPALAPMERIGRISGWAWGFGYAGGLVCLVLVLFGLVKADPPPFGLDASRAEPVRAAALLVAAWMAVFTLPLMLWVRDPAPEGAVGTVAAARRAIGGLIGAVRGWPREARIGRFLLARMLYTDGLNTLFAFGGVYAAGTFGLSLSEVIVFGIALNVTAGLGATGFGWLDDVLGPKRVILVSLAVISGLGAVLVTASDPRLFWGLALGIFVGPAALAAATTAFESQRAGMATILVFLAVGGALLATVPKTRP